MSRTRDRGAKTIARMRPTILVADDEAVLRALARATLSRAGYDVLEAADGQEALELAHGARPDVIVLDLMMPRKSGLEVLRELRADPELAPIPVVMLTARTRTADRRAAAEAGTDRFLAKPFSPRELSETVAELLG